MVTLLLILMTYPTLASAQKYSDWSAPVNLGATLNSASLDNQPAISKKGLSLYFASNRAAGVGNIDLYVSQRTSVDDAWGVPVNLGPTVNTISNEGNPAFSTDGHFMFFQSDRSGGFGSIDIWVSYREHTHDDFAWQTPVNLGAQVNSSAQDTGPAYFENEEDGLPQLYFGSGRVGGSGGTDLYVSEQLSDGSFGAAVRIPELSSTGNETRPSVSRDGLEVFFQSDRVGSVGPSMDLWVATRESTLDVWSTPVNLGSPINTALGEQHPYILSDNKTLFFSSDRAGGFGGPDLYMITRTKLRGPSELN